MLDPPTVRIGFVGPCLGDIGRLRSLFERLLFDLKIDRAIYLAADDALDRALPGWAEALGAPADDEGFFTEAALLARDAPPDVLDALLARDARRHRLADLACLPEARDRAVEMFEDRVVLMVYDKSVLDEDDIANATVVAYGQSPRPDLRTIGARGFISPGVAAGGHVGVVEARPEGIAMALHGPAGGLLREAWLPRSRGARLAVRSP